MTTIKLNDETYKEFHIITRSEWSANQYTGKASFDRNVRTAFLPEYGATLLFENCHFLVIPDKAPRKRYVVWRNHKIIGRCELPKGTADRANKATNAVFWFEPEAGRKITSAKQTASHPCGAAV